MTNQLNMPKGTRNVRRYWVVGAAALVIAAALTWIGVSSGRTAPSKSTGAAQAPRSAISNDAMKGMQGMPGTAAPPTSSGNVVLTPNQLREFGVTFGSAEMRTLGAESRATGVVTVDETRLARVATRVAGYAERVYASVTGATVARGAPLVDVYAPDVVAAEEELLLAQRLDRTIEGDPSTGENARSSLAGAARRRLQLMGVPDAQITSVLRTGRSSRYVTLYAPVSGAILEKAVVSGQAVSAGTTLYTIADLSRVWIDVSVRESDATALRPGAPAEVEIAGAAIAKITGRVAAVYPLVDPTTRSVRARVEVANPSPALRPGMFATVRLAAAERTGLTVPSSAVVATGERTIVFMDMGREGLMPMDVRVGRTAGGYTEILDGLSAGDRVVTSAQYLLESESNLGDVMRSMMSQGAGGMTGGGSAEKKGMPGMEGMPGMSMPAPSVPRPAAPTPRPR